MSDDSGFDRFLNTTKEVRGADFSLVAVANPIRWPALARAIFASVLGGLVVGTQTTVNAVLGLPATLLESAADWLARERDVFRYPGGRVELSGNGLIETVESGLLDVISAAWNPVAGLGWLAYPVALAEILVSLYIVVWAASYVREEVV